ncbi:MAG: hypothetical protein ACE5J7_00565 [Candidatus Aenigmatarchaeota archaeon]
MNVPIERMCITIGYKNEDEEKIREKWSKILDINEAKFRFQKSNRHKFETVDVQINSFVFRVIFQNILEHSLQVIKRNKKLRRGFLRGYFAAEGTIGFKEKDNCIEYIGFSYNPLGEGWLRNFCIDCLRIEGIKAKYKERDGNRAEIIINKWKNYSKLWEIRIFDRCERKKQKFTKILNSREFYCKLNDEFRLEFFDSINLYQRDIAKIINSWQGNVCKTIQGKHLMTINQIKRLIPYSKFSKEDINKNIEGVRIGNMRGFVSDKYLPEKNKEEGLD